MKYSFRYRLLHWTLLATSLVVLLASACGGAVDNTDGAGSAGSSATQEGGQPSPRAPGSGGAAGVSGESLGDAGTSAAWGGKPEGGTATVNAGAASVGGAGEAGEAGDAGGEAASSAAGAGGAGGLAGAGTHGHAGGPGGGGPQGYVPGLCDAASPVATSLPSCTLNNDDLKTNSCRKCLKSACCKSWQACFGDAPTTACGWGSTFDAPGQYECVRRCYSYDMSTDPDKEILARCEDACLDQCESEGVVTSDTRELLACTEANCAVECLSP